MKGNFFIYVIIFFLVLIICNKDSFIFVAESRITRLEDLKAKSYLVSKQVADVQLSRSTDYYIDVIKEAYNQASTEAIIGKSESALRLYDDGKYPTYVFEDDKTFIEIADTKTGKAVKRIEIQKDEVIPKFKEMSTKQLETFSIRDGKGPIILSAFGMIQIC